MKRPFGRNQEPIIKPVRLAEDRSDHPETKPEAPVLSSSVNRSFGSSHAPAAEAPEAPQAPESQAPEAPQLAAPQASAPAPYPQPSVSQAAAPQAPAPQAFAPQGPAPQAPAPPTAAPYVPAPQASVQAPPAPQASVQAPPAPQASVQAPPAPQASVQAPPAPQAPAPQPPVEQPPAPPTEEERALRLAQTAIAVEDRNPAADEPFAVRPDGNRFGELLIRKQLVDRPTLVDALMQQTEGGQRLGAMLVDLGAISERDLASALSEHLGVPLANLRNHKPDSAATALLKDHEARELSAIPVRVREDDVIEVAVADPTPDVRRVLEHLMKKPGKIEFLIAPASEITRLIEGTYRAVDAIEAQIKAFRANEITSKPQVKVQPVAPMPGHGADAPVVQVVNMLIAQALRDRASDVHIEPQDEQVRVRFRVDGALHDVITLPGTMGPALCSRIKIMAGMNIVERRRPQDGQTSLSIDGRALDIRISSTPTVFGEKVVMRLLDKSKPLFRAADLGLPHDTHEKFAKLVHSPFGMVVCVGPTGAGKTTTLYATLGELTTNERNIMTIEDPVEYVIPEINQIQINEQAGVTFADGLRSILRQDPDVILVGEIRDAETARIAVQSALTGHLVLSSLHATDTAAAIHRFLDMGIEAFLVASSVVGIVGQRLVRKVCQSCKVAYMPSDEEMAFWREAGGSAEKTSFFHGEGCNFCSGTGYQDRIGVYELLRVTPEVKRLIVGWATQEEIRRMAISQGMRTLLQEGLELVENDTTTIAEVIRVIYAS